jgi:hypothetical protein
MVAPPYLLVSGGVWFRGATGVGGGEFGDHEGAGGGEDAAEDDDELDNDDEVTEFDI